MRKSAKLCLYGVVIAGVVGGTAAWATTDKTIAVSIDGNTRTIHTHGATVGEALSSAKIAVGEHDVVAPVASAKIADKGKIVLRKGRLLHLTVDGSKVDVWTTATTVDDALAALGYGDGNKVSVSRSTRLPLSATDLTLLTPKPVTLKVDGAAQAVTTTAATVGELLTASGITLGQFDTLSVPADSDLTAGQVVTVQRVSYVTKDEPQPIPFTTQSSNDPSTTSGTTVVVTKGKNGSQTSTIQYIYVDGQLAGQLVLNTVVTAQPVPQVQKVGTKPAATPATATPTKPATPSTGGGSTTTVVPAGEAQAIAAQMVAARGWGNDQFGCLVSLWNRESHWNVHAANSSGAYGIPQALPGSKMGSAGPDWQNNATTQITWGLGYIAGRYGTPCGAWSHSQSSGWY